MAIIPVLWEAEVGESQGQAHSAQFRDLLRPFVEI